MKILAIQLARFGDIYMNWPALRALKRSVPNAEIHFLTRAKFAAASEGLECISKHHHLVTESILEPIIETQDVQGSLNNLDSFSAALRSENFDWIINFTFSPFSSYLTHFLASETTKVSGYTRHSDGYLSFGDELSSYFYAQVGIGRSNRMHVCDLFAGLAGVEIDSADWAGPTIENEFKVPSTRYLALHIGASQQNKSLPGFKWARAAKFFLEENSTHDIILLGSKSESSIAEEITGNCHSRRIINLVGQTNLLDIFKILKQADLLVGCDSAPMHMASLTNTPCFNLSFNSVNFWESGPRAFGSVVFRSSTPMDVSSETLGRMIAKLLRGDVDQALIPSQVGTPAYHVFESDESRFNWDLIQALYLGEVFPIANRLTFVEAVEQLRDVNQICLENLSKVRADNVINISKVIDRADEILNVLCGYDEGIAVLVRWYQAQKVRIPPQKSSEVLRQMKEVHENFEQVLKMYSMKETSKRVG